MHKQRNVLETKLMPPQIKEKVLRRRRLLNLLNRNLDKKFILICADAGYGKTTLLTQLCVILNKPFIFYDLDPSDNDIATFFSYLVAGIQKRFPDFGVKVGSLIHQTRNSEMLAGTFINELVEKIKGIFYIILDDYQNLQGNKDITSAVDHLMRYLPNNLRLVIASRVLPPFNWSYYLAKQELLKLDRDNLRFNSNEVHSLLEEIYQMHVTTAEVARVEKYSEGWITAIQLILQEVITSGGDDMSRTLNGYVASGEEIFNYFAREVYENLPDKFKIFLVKTSFLDRLSVDACNDLLSIKNSQAILEKLKNDHIFIDKIDDATYKFHHLFQKFVNDLARRNLGRTGANLIFANIAETFKRRNDFESAIDYYLKGERYQPAIRCLRKVASLFIHNCRFNRYIQWLNLIPEELMVTDIELMVIKAQILYHTAATDEALILLNRAAKLAGRLRDQKQLFAINYEIAKIYATTNKFNEALSCLKKCRTIGMKSKDRLADIFNLEGVCYAHLNDFSRAEKKFNQALEIIDRFGGSKQNYNLMNNMAIVAFTKGKLTTALKIFRRILKAKPSRLLEPHINSNLAICLIDLGRLPEARRSLAHGYWLSKEFVNRRGQLAFLLALGTYYCEIGIYGKSLKYLRDLIKMANESNDKMYELKAMFSLAETLYFAGRFSEAKELSEELITKSQIPFGIRDHGAFMTKGLIELQLGNKSEAEKTLMKCLALVEKTDFKYSLMQNCYHLAFLYQIFKNKRKTEYYLRLGLRLAKDNNYDYFIMKMAKRHRSLLQFAVARNIFRNYVDSILEKIVAETEISIRLFGHLEIFIDGKMVDVSQWQTKKAQLVFVYLILNQKHFITKEQLMEKFSSQTKPALANQDIRTTISRIQKAMMNHKVIRYEQGVYKINNRLNLRVDVEEFERFVKGVLNRQDPLNVAAVADTERALALYKDDFLVSCYDDWCEDTRSYFRNLYISLVNRVGEHYFNQANYTTAVRYFEMAVSKDFLNETGNLGLIKCLLKIGKRVDALYHYKQFTKQFRKQMGMEPPWEFEKLQPD